MAGVHRDAIQKQIHQDWANREYIEVITASIKRITDFLNSFGKVASFIVTIRIVLFFLHTHTQTCLVDPVWPFLTRN